jgi:hypothetical protein
MTFNRYAKRIDANQTEVISALEAAGAQVLVLSKPVDLLVGIAGRLALFEVKDGKKCKSDQAPTKAQKKFMGKWLGYPICTVDGPEAALEMLNVIKSGAKLG